MVQGADTGNAEAAAAVVTTGMLLPAAASEEIWPAEWADKTPAAAADGACGMTAPTECETVGGCSANAESGGTCGCECAGVSTGATVFCEKIA